MTQYIDFFKNVKDLITSLEEDSALSKEIKELISVMEEDSIASEDELLKSLNSMKEWSGIGPHNAAHIHKWVSIDVNKAVNDEALTTALEKFGAKHFLHNGLLYYTL